MKKLVMTMVCVMGDSALRDDLHEMSYMCVTDDYKVMKLRGTTIINKIMDRKIEFTNMCVSIGRLQVNNGKYEDYTFIDTKCGKVIGDRASVILDCIVKSGEIIGYTVFNRDGAIKEVMVDELLYKLQGKISNGVVVNTPSGVTVKYCNRVFGIKILGVNGEVIKRVNRGKSKVDIIVKDIGVKIGIGKNIEYSKVEIRFNRYINKNEFIRLIKDGNRHIVREIKNRVGFKQEVDGDIGFIYDEKDKKIEALISIDTLYGIIELNNGNFKIKTLDDNGYVDIVCEDYSGSISTKVSMDKCGTILEIEEGNDKSDEICIEYANRFMNDINRLLMNT